MTVAAAWRRSWNRSRPRPARAMSASKRRVTLPGGSGPPIGQQRRDRSRAIDSRRRVGPPPGLGADAGGLRLQTPEAGSSAANGRSWGPPAGRLVRPPRGTRPASGGEQYGLTGFLPSGRRRPSGVRAPRRAAVRRRVSRSRVARVGRPRRRRGSPWHHLARWRALAVSVPAEPRPGRVRCGPTGHPGPPRRPRSGGWRERG